MSAVTETELKQRAVAPRVTAEDLQASIKSIEYLYSQTLTICILTLTNGFTVTGESACADPANYKKDIGDRIARENAQNKIWPLLGFELRTRLQRIGDAGQPTGAILSFGSAVKTYHGTKVIRAVPMTRAAYNEYRGWELPKDEVGSDPGFLVEYVDGGTTNVPGHAGYISWSPKAVFERAYTDGVTVPGRIDTFLTRMQDEYEELAVRRDKLRRFVDTEAFYKLSQEDQADLRYQFSAMTDYVWYLGKRLKRLGGTA